MVKKGCTNMILISVLLLFIVMVMINKTVKESYVAAPRARVRADARIYTGPGDALRGPVAPARRKKKVVVVWYNPVTWVRWW
jgi:hypothetical protein